MKKFFAAGIAVAALVRAPAMAAELPFPAPAPVYGVVAPPPILRFSWTSCYLGGHLGGGWGTQRFSGALLNRAVPTTVFGPPTTITIPPATPGAPPTIIDFFTGTPGPAAAAAITQNSFEYNSTGLLIGGQVGCNLQFARRWVIGFEADVSWANRQGDTPLAVATNTTFTTILPGIVDTTSSTGVFSGRTDLISTLTARLGFTFGNFGQGLLYAKGGAAWVRNKYQFAGAVSNTNCALAQQNVSPIPGPPICVATTNFGTTPFQFGFDEWRGGWTLGAGLEWAMFGNWSLKLEYDYLDLGDRTVTFNAAVLPATSTSIGQRISEIKFGINYRFLGDPLPLL
jgi:outer membrane immunogenic protein